MSKRQRKTREKRRRHAEPTSRRIRSATVTGSLAATAVIGLASGAETADAQGFDAALVKDINPTAMGEGNPSRLVNVDGTLFFRASDGPDDGPGGVTTHGYELWMSDGTEAGTRMVKDINPTESSNPAQLTNVGGTLFFTADDGPSGQELWKSDGTEAGTELVANIRAGTDTSSPYDLTDVGGTLFFSAYDGPDGGATNGRELWKSDGTTTELVEDINASGNSTPYQFAEVGGDLFFSAYDGPDDGPGGVTTHARELWRSDGTTTELVEDINTSGDSYPSDLTAVGGNLFFSAYDGTDNGTTQHGNELWTHDPAMATTDLVEDINASSGSYPRELTGVGGTLFFVANDDVNGRELWKSDGTVPGTELVEDINASGGSVANQLTDIDGTLYFGAYDGPDDGPGGVPTHGLELWRSDGSAAGTALVRDINPSGNSDPRDLTDLGSNFFFEADDGATGEELWRSDGTAAGTALVEDINPMGDADTIGLTAVGGTLFFNARDGTNGRELWKAFAIPGASAPSQPSNQFSATGTDRNPKKGTATLSFDLPGPGQLDAEQETATGASAAAKRKKGKKIKPTSVSVAPAGPAKLTIRPTKAGRRILERKGKLKVKVRVTFTPVGGSPSSQVLTVLLKLK